MKVTILTPTRDRPGFLPRCIRSVLQQDHPDWEQIIYDVGDRPIEDLIPDDPRILYHRGKAAGPATDFQYCLERASGTLIHPLSDDDRLSPHALSTAVTMIGDAEWLCARTAISGTHGELLALRGGNPVHVRMTLAGQYMLGGAVYWRKTLTDRVGGFNPGLTGAADYDLYMRFLKDSWPKLIPDVLYLYTDHPGTDSRVNMERQGAHHDRIAATHRR